MAKTAITRTSQHIEFNGFGHRHHDQAEVAYFHGDRAMVEMLREDYEDLNEPSSITVTIVPGNSMEEGKDLRSPDLSALSATDYGNSG